jgi:A/G-specific adenine glycosylase
MAQKSPRGISSAAPVAEFRRAVWKHYRAVGRHDLPWRTIRNSYRILVSEVMLQQTQVARVKEKYKEFLGFFPTVTSLASAPLRDVLRVWSGMGYNRRAKYLRDAAQTIVSKHKARIPKDLMALRALPGIGEYTASAVCVFAFNQPHTLIETNIRAAFIHHFFSHNLADRLDYGKVKDSEIRVIAERAAKGQDPREWHWALMDYGAYIKKLHKNPARRSASYAKQSKFEGSLRQVRGAILRAIVQSTSMFDIQKQNKKLFQDALDRLMQERIIKKAQTKWTIA